MLLNLVAEAFKHHRNGDKYRPWRKESYEAKTDCLIGWSVRAEYEKWIPQIALGRAGAPACNAPESLTSVAKDTVVDIQRFYRSLPHLNSWIAATLDAHRERAHFVGSMGFTKLPAYFPVHLLASVQVIEVVEIPVPPLTALGLPEFGDFEGINASGITYLDTVFVLSGQAWNESLYFHELVHAVQWQYLGPDKFLLAYGVGLSQGGYYANPMETMAYELQAAFDRGHPPFDVATEVARRLDTIVPSMLERAA